MEKIVRLLVLSFVLNETLTMDCLKKYCCFCSEKPNKSSDAMKSNDNQDAIRSRRDAILPEEIKFTPEEYQKQLKDLNVGFFITIANNGNNIRKNNTEKSLGDDKLKGRGRLYAISSKLNPTGYLKNQETKTLFAQMQHMKKLKIGQLFRKEINQEILKDFFV